MWRGGGTQRWINTERRVTTSTCRGTAQVPRLGLSASSRRPASWCPPRRVCLTRAKRWREDDRGSPVVGVVASLGKGGMCHEQVPCCGCCCVSGGGGVRHRVAVTGPVCGVGAGGDVRDLYPVPWGHRDVRDCGCSARPCGSRRGDDPDLLRAVSTLRQLQAFARRDRPVGWWPGYRELDAVA